MDDEVIHKYMNKGLFEEMIPYTGSAQGRAGELHRRCFRAFRKSVYPPYAAGYLPELHLSSSRLVVFPLF